MARVDPVDPACVQVQEVERDVTHVGNGQHVEVARQVRRQRQQDDVKAKVRPHSARGRAVAVHLGQILGQPTIDRPLIQGARRSRHGGHDSHEQTKDHQDHKDLRHSIAAANHVAQSFANARAVNDARCQHARLTQHALEGEGDQEVEHAAQQARIEYSPERIGLGVLEFRGVAHSGFKPVGRPCRDVQATQEQGPAAIVPCAIHAGIRGCGGQQAHDIGAVNRTGQDRDQSHQQQRHQHNDRQPLLRRGCVGNAAMLNGKHDQHQDHANHEGRVEMQRAHARDSKACRFPCAESGGQGCDSIRRSNSRDRIRRRRACIGCDIVDHRLRGRRIIGGMGCHPFQHHGAVSRRDREQRVQDITCRDGTAQGQNRTPGKPVAPDRQRRNQFGIAQPCCRPIHRSPARLVAEHAGHFGIGEALQKAHHHRNDPYQESQLSGRARDPTNREQHQGRHTGRNPESALPI